MFHSAVVSLIYTPNQILNMFWKVFLASHMKWWISHYIINYWFVDHFQLVKRHAAEIFTSVIISTLFSLYSTAFVGRLVQLEPSLTVSILPRCITVALALSIVSLFDGKYYAHTATIYPHNLVYTGIWSKLMDKIQRSCSLNLFKEYIHR